VSTTGPARLAAELAQCQELMQMLEAPLSRLLTASRSARESGGHISMER
jgi:hypothetical protein